MSGDSESSVSRLQAEVAELRRTLREREDELARAANDRERLVFLSWIVEQSSEGIAVADGEGVLVYVNRAWATMHGFDDPTELIGKNLAVSHSPEQMARDVEPFNRLVRAHGCHTGEVGHVKADGTPFSTLMTTTLLHGEDGQALAIAGIARDITDLKRAQELAARERSRAQLYLDVANVILVALDRDGVVTLVNRRGAEVLGAPEDEIVGRSWFATFLPEDQRDATLAVFHRLMAGEEVAAESWVNPVVTRSGERRLVSWRNAVVRDADGTIIGTLSSGSDVTERTRLEEQLRQSQKLEAIGQLAGGVAHDFSNILQAIFTHLEFAQSALPADHPAADDVRGIMDGASKAADLTRQLLAFSRRQVLAPCDVDLNELIAGLLKMLRRIIGENVALEFRTSRDTALVHADTGQLELVLLNLCVNARDAMPGGGVIAISTDVVTVSEELRRAQGWPTGGEFVLLKVEDSGCGMDEATRVRIFEPFFTTKEPGHGTGLGLATVYGIVTQHGGLIEVQSTPGHGSVFDIYLPRVEPSGGGPAVAVPTAAAGGHETLLLAEDDEAVRRLTVRALEEAGYRVVAAADGHRAVAAFVAHREVIALAVVDVVMPRWGGIDVARRLAVARPDLPVLFTTGYATDGDQLRAALESRPGRTRLLSKPYTSAALLAAVRELLDA